MRVSRRLSTLFLIRVKVSGILACALAASLCLPARAAWQGVSLAGASGLVQLRPSSEESWRSLERGRGDIRPGAELRTGRESAAYVRLGDGATVLLQQDSLLAVEEDVPGRLTVRVDIGVGVFEFPGEARRRVQVRTPSAAMTVRGGDFRLSVLGGGRTTVELSRGAVGVEDNRGHQVLLRAGESVRVDLRGLEVPQRIPAEAQLRREGLRERIAHEAEDDSFREGVGAAAVASERRIEWEEGRVLIDGAGDRVRAESWVRRPSADQLELVSLDSTRGGDSYFYRLNTYSSAVPDDISGALRAAAGTAGAAPPLTLVSYEAARSNGTDVVLEKADGGHLVDVNSNADGSDDVSAVFDPVAGVFVGASGLSAWRSVFDRYGLYLDGRLASGYTGSNLQAVSAGTPSSTMDPFSGAALTSANALMDPGGGLATRTVSVTAPGAGSVREDQSSTWSDGSSLLVGSSGLADGSASGTSPPASGTAAAFRSALPGRWVEQTLTSPLFGGRSIDLTLDPRTALSQGLLP
ncbi:MAG: FecR domain-containing protein [Elusimicrobia bacterium]|nr:FecR domain-containing protein [Elusimicrobiota bacterium]